MDRDYAGIVEHPFELRLGGQVKFTLTGMRVIKHPFPLFLIGADILCGGNGQQLELHRVQAAHQAMWQGGEHSGIRTWG